MRGGSAGGRTRTAGRGACARRCFETEALGVEGLDRELCILGLNPTRWSFQKGYYCSPTRRQKLATTLALTDKQVKKLLCFNETVLITGWELVYSFW